MVLGRAEYLACEWLMVAALRTDLGIRQSEKETRANLGRVVI
jgi:hypothetical protein